MTNDQAPMTNQGMSLEASKERVFDLAERTAKFGENVIQFARTVRRDAVTMPLISQLVRAATSIGANYLDADEAGSRKEFTYRISLYRREARETQYRLRLIAAASVENTDSARKLWKEARELVLIFGSIHRNAIKHPK